MGIARAHDLLVGRTLGEFVLRERIGEGGFGAVYRAIQPALDREAVVKVLHQELHASASATERFLREAKLASKLDHPYAAHIYAFGAEDDGELWIAMELVRGTPLDQILKIQGPLSLARLGPLLDRICEVVQTAHEQGIVHRDLKPANVMVLARAGRLLPKLLDFGIAKGLADARSIERADTSPPIAEVDVTAHTLAARSTGDDATAHTLPGEATGPDDGGLTQRGAIIGSPRYMPPEQWLDAGLANARTDLYALGILAYECLTGKPPFQGATLTMIAHAHANDQAPPLGPGFPVALDGVLARALAKDASDRYPDALAFAAAFRQAAGIATDAPVLPTLDAARRDAVVTGAPQPIAETVAALDVARNAHHARDALVQVARAITRYVAVLALACRSRVQGGHETLEVSDRLRALHRRVLGDVEWLELARALTRVWADCRDAYPVPELVDVFDRQDVFDDLTTLATLRDREPASDEDARAVRLPVYVMHNLIDANERESLHLTRVASLASARCPCAFRRHAGGPL